MKIKILALSLAFLLGSMPVGAVDDLGCPAGTVCATDPASIVTAMQEEGYKAKLEKDGMDDPKIASKANGYDFEVYFYGCKNHKGCKEIQFSAGFAPASDQTAEYANKWNAEKRFIKASVNEKKEMDLQWDLTTVGGINKANFADVLDWWVTMLGEFSNFVEKQKSDTEPK